MGVEGMAKNRFATGVAGGAGALLRGGDACWATAGERVSAGELGLRARHAKNRVRKDIQKRYYLLLEAWLLRDSDKMCGRKERD